MCLRKVTGWDRHVKNPLGLCGLSGPHTFLPSFFLSCYPPLHTKRHTDTHTQLNYMSRWSVEFICNPLRSALFSKSHDRSHIIFRPSLRTSITQTPSPYLSTSHFLAILSCLHLCVRIRGNQTGKGLWLYACTSRKLGGPLSWIENVSGIKYLFLGYKAHMLERHLFTSWFCLHMWSDMAAHKTLTGLLIWKSSVYISIIQNWCLRGVYLLLALIWTLAILPCPLIFKGFLNSLYCFLSSL